MILLKREMEEDKVRILVKGITAPKTLDTSVLDKLEAGRKMEEGRVAPKAYLTSVSLTSSPVCLCCTGQQARRCSLNIGKEVLKVLYNG